MNLRCKLGWHDYEIVKEVYGEWLYKFVVYGEDDWILKRDPLRKLSFEEWFQRRVCMRCGFVDDQIARKVEEYEGIKARKEQAGELFRVMSS